MAGKGIIDKSVRLSGVVGQEKAKKLITRTVSTGRIGHAYLFRGPEGVGKKMFAQIFAAWLNCPQPLADGGCGTCPSCRKYRSGNHPDICYVEPENGAIKIDQIRTFCRSLAYPPYESAYRVSILEDVHEMRAEAANSLLKTLEEPPSQNVLVLTAESSKAVLPTIISRCQELPFYELSRADSVAVLQQHRPDLEAAKLELLARLSEGCPGKALRLAENELVELYEKSVRVLEQTGSDNLESGDEVLLKLSAEMATLKDELFPFFGLLRIWIAAKMREASQLRNWSQPYQKQLCFIDEAERQLQRNCNRNLVCEVLLFNLQSSVARLS